MSSPRSVVRRPRAGGDPATFVERVLGACLREGDTIERAGDDVRLFVDCPPEFAELLVEKGSVAIDGVSLTVVGVQPDGFDVALIPHTLAVTTLGERAPGDRVNLEADVLGKYVKKYLERVLPRPRGEGS